MFALTITTLVVGLAAGLYLAIRFLPPLADTREGTIATWTIRVFVGCATAWAAVVIYDIIHAYATHTRSEGGFPSIDKSEVLRAGVQDILLTDGILIGAAAIIYLLAPTGDARDQAP